MKSLFIIAFIATALGLYLQFPADEAAVRAAIVGVAYVAAYVVARAISHLLRRRRQNGR